MRKIGVVFIGLLSAGLANAENPQPPLEAYGALPQISDAELSPDGTKVAAIANVPSGARMIVFNIETGGIGDAIGIEKIKARNVEFFDNQHVILKASETRSTFGFVGEYENHAAFAINMQTNVIRALLDRTRDLYPAQGGLDKIIGRGKNPGEVLMPAWVGEAGRQPSKDLLKVKLSSPVGRSYAKGTDDTLDWFVGESGKILARTRYNNKHNMFRVQYRDGDKWITIFEEEQEIPMAIWGVMPDESGLVVSVSLDDDIGSSALKRLAWDGEETGPVVPFRVGEIETILKDNNRKIIGVRYAGVEPDYMFLDERLQASFESVSAQLPDATIYLDSWSDDRNVMLYQVFAPSLGDVWLIHRSEDDSLGLVANRRPQIPPDAIGYMMSIDYSAQDGLTIQAILTVPPDYDPENTPPLPTIVLPHGGPADYDRFDFNFIAQFFANRGYAVLQPNFRGSKGFGRAFENAGRGEWGGQNAGRHHRRCECSDHCPNHRS